MKTSFLKKWSPLIVVLILGGILGLWNITLTPPSLNWDEVSHGYNAFSILKTGKDEWGASFPLIFRAFGDYKLPLYIYLTVLPVSILGLTTLAVRLVSVIAGIVAILGIYFFTEELFPGKRIKFLGTSFSLGLVSAIVLAFLPWHFFLSRPALEANLFLTLFIYSCLFLYRSLKDQKNMIVASIFLGLSLHTYNSARVVVPALLLGFFFVFKPRIRINRHLLVSLIILLFTTIPVVTQTITGVGVARYQKLQILSESTVHIIGQNRLSSKLPQPLPKLIYNRPVFLTTSVIKNYLGYFTPTFFTQSHGAQTQFAIPGQNLLTIVGLVLFYIGLVLSLKNSGNNRANQFILLCLAVSPLAAALTSDPPQAIRPISMILPVVCLITVSLDILSRISEKLFLTMLILYIIFSGQYIFIYSTRYSTEYSASWQYGYQQAIDFVTQHRNEYSKVFITKRFGEPHIFYSFYSQLDPRVLQSDKNTIRFHQSDWFWTDRIENVYFVNDWDIPITSTNQLKLESGGVYGTNNSLLVTSFDHQPINSHLLKEINFLDGQPAFKIVSLP